MLLLILFSCIVCLTTNTKIPLPAGDKIRIPRVTETEDALDIFFETVDRPIKLPQAEIITGAYTDTLDRAQLEDGSMRVMPEIDTIDPRLWPEYAATSRIRLTHSRSDDEEEDDELHTTKVVIIKRDTNEAVEKSAQSDAQSKTAEDKAVVTDDISDDKDLLIESSETVNDERSDTETNHRASLPADNDELTGVDRLLSILNEQKANTSDSALSSLLGAAAAIEESVTTSSGIIVIDDNISHSESLNETFMEYLDSDETVMQKEMETTHKTIASSVSSKTNVTNASNSSEQLNLKKDITASTPIKVFNVDDVLINEPEANYTAFITTGTTNGSSVMHNNYKSNVGNIPTLQISLLLFSAIATCKFIRLA